MINIGIVGAGIAGLVQTYNICKKPIGKTSITIFEKSSKIGGRAHTSTNQAGLRFDLGANLIDFLDIEARQKWKDLLPPICETKLIPFQKPFLIFHNETGTFKCG